MVNHFPAWALSSPRLSLTPLPRLSVLEGTPLATRSDPSLRGRPVPLGGCTVAQGHAANQSCVFWPRARPGRPFLLFQDVQTHALWAPGFPGCSGVAFTPFPALTRAPEPRSVDLSCDGLPDGVQLGEKCSAGTPEGTHTPAYPQLQRVHRKKARGREQSQLKGKKSLLLRVEL